MSYTAQDVDSVPHLGIRRTQEKRSSCVTVFLMALALVLVWIAVQTI